jgi:glycosyltransferase involved in cell wall biosynthesis
MHHALVQPKRALAGGRGAGSRLVGPQAQRLGIAHKLVFTGVVPRSQVPAEAMAFDIALQTALVPYASPLCLFEYMAMGKAILAPDQPNHHEVLVQGTDCEMYAPADPQGIERRLDGLVDDTLRRHTLGEQARQALTARGYYWEGNARRVLDAAQAVTVAAATAP